MNRRRFLTVSGLGLMGIGSSAWYWENRWEYIVIHHSAGNYGNIPFLQKVHRERQAKDPIDAIPYHYIIGNGNGLGMGEIDSDWRNDWGIWGAHVSIRNRARNFKGIGICLIGNYEHQAIPQQQYNALVKLTRQLMATHNIPVENINGHGLIEGEKTKCPGKHFPMVQFKQDIAHKDIT